MYVCFLQEEVGSEDENYPTEYTEIDELKQSMRQRASELDNSQKIPARFTTGHVYEFEETEEYDETKGRSRSPCGWIVCIILMVLAVGALAGGMGWYLGQKTDQSSKKSS